MRELLIPLISIADETSDDDDIRLRKRVGVVAGYLTVIAPRSVIGAARDRAIGLPLGLSLSVLGAVNLAVLARSRRFERYVVVLISAGTIFTVAAIILQGGVDASSAAMMWAFLAPVFAILALGPRRAMAWFIVFLVALAAVVAIDPVVSGAFPPPPMFSASFPTRSTLGHRQQSSSYCCGIPISVDARRRHGPRSCSRTPYRCRLPSGCNTVSGASPRLTPRRRSSSRTSSASRPGRSARTRIR